MHLFGKIIKKIFYLMEIMKSNNVDFDNYLKRLGYNFKNQNNELGGYAILNNKKISLIMDIGSSPDKKFSTNYQAGCIVF